MVDSEGAVEVYRQMAPGVVHHRVMYDPGEGSENLLAHGIYTIQTVDVSGGKPDISSRRTFAYPQQPADMPLPEPGGAWSTGVTANEGGALKSETHSYEYGDRTTLTIADCSYDMIPVVARFSADQGYVETLYYLPEAGIALYGAYTDADGSQTYTFKSIERTAP